MQETRDVGLIPGSGRSPGVGHGTLLQNSCLENWIEEPGGLESMGPQRAGHDWTTEHNAHKLSLVKAS